MRFLRLMREILWTFLIELPLLLMQESLSMIRRRQVWRLLINLSNKNGKKEQNEIVNDKIQDGTRFENRLTSKVKVENQFMNKINKNRKRIRKSYIEHVKSRMDEYYEKKFLRARTTKCKKNNLGEAATVANVNGEALQRTKKQIRQR